MQIKLKTCMRLVEEKKEVGMKMVIDMVATKVKAEMQRNLKFPDCKIGYTND